MGEPRTARTALIHRLDEDGYEWEEIHDLIDAIEAELRTSLAAGVRALEPDEHTSRYGLSMSGFDEGLKAAVRLIEGTDPASPDSSAARIRREAQVAAGFYEDDYPASPEPHVPNRPPKPPAPPKDREWA